MLLDPATSIFVAEEIARASGTKTERRGLRRYVPSISRNRIAASNYQQLAGLLADHDPPARVLIVGAGEGGEGASMLLRQPGLRALATDVSIGRSTDVVLDCHQIPFADKTFDAVVVQAVLEHVLDPFRCVAEITRVLREDGIVYAETPFMQQVHMGAFDITRFTPVGHRRLFAQFEEIASGIAVGPGSALAWSLTYFFSSFPRSRAVRRYVNIAARFAFFYLKYFDRVLNSRPGAWDAAGGVYFLGRLSGHKLSEVQVLKSYRGAME